MIAHCTTLTGDAAMTIGNVAADHLVIVLIGYIIVFASLAILSLVFINLPKLLTLSANLLKRSRTEDSPQIRTQGQLSVEEAAAISAALFLFVEELHDEEARVLTIQKISKRYSPWNSKIYNVVNGLNKKFQV